MQHESHSPAHLFLELLVSAAALCMFLFADARAGSSLTPCFERSSFSDYRTSGIAPSVLTQSKLNTVGAKDRGGSILRDFWDDVVYLTRRPGFFAVVGGLSLSPIAFRSGLRREEPELTEMWGMSSFADGFFELGEGLGQGVYPVAGSAMLWAIGGATGNRSAQSLGSDILRAQAINGLLTAAMKGAINRTRPDGAPYGYPSGHTSSAFATVGVIYQHFGFKAGIPAFVLASYVGLSRLQENKHYMSDVIAGGILGGYIGYTIAGRKQQDKTISVSPLQLRDARGLALSLRF